MRDGETFVQYQVRKFRRNFPRMLLAVLVIAVVGATLKLEFNIDDNLVYGGTVIAAVFWGIWHKVQEAREDAAVKNLDS